MMKPLSIALVLCCSTAHAQDWRDYWNIGRESRVPYYRDTTLPFSYRYPQPVYGRSTRIGDTYRHYWSDGSYGVSRRLGRTWRHRYYPPLGW